MSGYPDNILANHGLLEAGITLIQKPFNVQTLVAKVREVLR
jgi:DNA-binding response OmpR family regulator